MSKLPVSVISPVRNCIDALPKHAAHLRSLAEVAAELIVVDSDSNDGTFEFLKRELDGPGVVFLNHPPGLYPSWNHGIAHASQRYCTIATVGDPLPVESLVRMVETIENFSADAVVSAPEMIVDDCTPSIRQWPVHHLINGTGMTGPQVVDPVIWAAFAFGFFPATLLSSSAGNLYQTRLLKENPFPTDYGHAGDSVWALAMSRKAKWVIDPQVKSYFWVHAATGNYQKRNEAHARAITEMANEYYLTSEPLFREAGLPEDLLAIIKRSPDQLLERTLIQLRYSEVRKSYLPRFLQPEASRLKKAQRKLDLAIAARRGRMREFARELGAVTRSNQ